METLKLIAELERDEGLRLTPYFDNAKPPKLTIGVGRNLAERGIRREEAYLMLHNDIDDTTAALDEHLAWWRKLDEVRQRVLANMAFNLGVGPTPENPTGKLLTFAGTLKLIEQGDYATASEHMLATLWAKQVGVRATRLAQMMRTGEDHVAVDT